MFIIRPFGRIFTISFLALLLAFPYEATSAEDKIPLMDSPGLVKMVREEGKGRVVLISVFASWCPPCREEMPVLVESRKNIAQKDLLLIGLSIDENISDLKAFMQEQKINFPVYSGTDELMMGLGVGAIPHTFVFNRKGEIVENYVGLMPAPQFKLMLARLVGEPGV